MSIDDTPEPSAKELYQALDAHSRRSPEAIEMDNTIQAREQVADFGIWSQGMNQMDFPGVDDYNPFGFLGGVVYDPTEEFE